MKRYGVGNGTKRGSVVMIAKMIDRFRQGSPSSSAHAHYPPGIIVMDPPHRSR